MGKLNKQQKAMYEAFMAEFPWCWTCGIGANRSAVGAAPAVGYPRNLENSHILRGPARRHDRRALTRQCKLCHDLHGRAIIRVNGEPLPHLSLANLLYVKRLFDREYYDPEYLNEISIGRIPEPERLPELFMGLLTARGRLASADVVKPPAAGQVGYKFP